MFLRLLPKTLLGFLLVPLFSGASNIKPSAKPVNKTPVKNSASANVKTTKIRGTGKKETAKTASYNSHLETAKGFGLSPVKNNADVKKLVGSKKLSVTKCNKGCTINKLTHSKPYLVPTANKVLNEIAHQFYHKTKSTFTVTSITRTLHDQKTLQKVNVNAKSGVSSHNYGASFDASYIRFNNKRAENPRLEKALYNVLSDFQKKGKIYFIKESKQRCFHVTVRS
ncbi:MAG TPA: DUF5715 family protein [Niabella sp.]|nr:DUF5715 family protein [Niabella sp.]